MKSHKSKTKDTIIQLLSNLANPKEINQYMKRFVNTGQSNFAVIKVGGAILENDLENLCSSLCFLEQIGLFPIVIHGAGPQLTRNLKEAGIISQFINGQRVTSAAVLKIAKNTFIQQNLKLSNRLQSMGVKTASITSGVFGATKILPDELGYVGTVNSIELEPIKTAINNGVIPILSSLAETDTGQYLNINADVATNQLAIALKPYKIILLTETGGLLDQHGNIISSVNLITDYKTLIQQDWVHSGMKLKLEQVSDMLNQLPASTSVSITSPQHLAKELFTHKGSGTLIKKGESIIIHNHIDSIQTSKIYQLLESSFNKKLDANYFENLHIHKAYITYCYRAAIITTLENDITFIDKFVVSDEARGEGLGKTIWESLVQDNSKIFWRCKPENPINGFYFANSSGCYKTRGWHVFWYGLSDFKQIENCINFALNKPETLN